MSLSRRERVLIFTAVLALLAACFVWFMYLPQQARIDAAQADQAQLKQEKTRLEAIRKKQEVTTPVNNDLAIVNEQLPAQQEMIPVLKFLDKSTQKCDVYFTSLEYKGAKEDEKEETKTLTFTVETSGSIFDLIDFLKELLSSPRFISVEDVALTASKAEKTNAADIEEREPVYYIAPPGIPQAKLDRVKIEIEEEEETVSQVEQPVADSFIPDEFTMKVTINAYYYPDQPANPDQKKTANDGTEKKDDQGRI